MAKSPVFPTCPAQTGHPPNRLTFRGYGENAPNYLALPMRSRSPFALLATLATPALLAAQPLHGQRSFTHADTLRGSNGPYRAWWDVTHYDVTVKPDFATRSILGRTTITFKVNSPAMRMQIDLQQPLEVDGVSTHAFDMIENHPIERDGDVIWIDLTGRFDVGSTGSLSITYHGVPHAAKTPPWDGGWIWKTDAEGNPWMSVACQGLGASIWYPCKDIQSDEPDSAALHIVVPDSLQAIGNGRLRSMAKNNDGTSTWNWAVVNPINTYDLIPYIGKYAHWSEVYPGINGPLDCDYWVLKDNEARARDQFKQAPLMLKCFEEWFGPYPFYKDGYKLVEAPHLGMEHQSAVAYGNGFQNGYLGRDLSGTGWGLKWDYIIVHESGHEWFGNSITTADIADMWVHEGFTMYSEVVYTECQSGRTAADEYVQGVRRNIRNDKPVIGPYGVNQEGSGDMYYKGANLLHTIRAIIGDSTFKAMLREMNRRFYHKITSSAEVEAFVSGFSHHDLSKVFDQYLRTKEIPVVEWGIRKGELYTRLSNCVAGLNMPVNIRVNGEEKVVPISDAWSNPAGGLKKTAQVQIDRNWYLASKQCDQAMIKRIQLPARRIDYRW